MFCVGDHIYKSHHYLVVDTAIGYFTSIDVRVVPGVDQRRYKNQFDQVYKQPNYTRKQENAFRKQCIYNIFNYVSMDKNHSANLTNL